MELLQEILNIFMYFIITGCGVIVVKKVLDCINAKIDDIQQNTKISEYYYLNEIIDQVQKTVTTVVTSVNQVFVDSLKASGSFNKEAAEEAKNMALKMATSLITEEAADAIKKAYGDINVYLDNLIESIVRELKN